jgi:hypothetical protein
MFFTSPLPRLYAAPLVAPTLHLVFTPLWLLVMGRQSEIVVVTAWQAIAWLYLAPLCTVTMIPLLWAARRTLPTGELKPVLAWFIVLASSAVSSLALLGAFKYAQSPLASWLAALLAALVLASHIRTKEHIGEEPVSSRDA